MNVGVIRYVIKTPLKTIKNDVEEYVVLSRIYRNLRRIYRQTRRQVIVDVEEPEQIERNVVHASMGCDLRCPIYDFGDPVPHYYETSCAYFHRNRPCGNVACARRSVNNQYFVVRRQYLNAKIIRDNYWSDVLQRQG